MARVLLRREMVEAWQFQGFEGDGWRAHIDSMPRWLAGLSQDRRGSPSLFIRTPHGDKEAAPGDWIISNSNAQILVCKPDIFEAFFTPADTSLARSLS